MAIHQCIYTNSAKGLDRGGGAGVYSYSPDMTKAEEQAFVQGYCSYPRREKGSYGEDGDSALNELPTKLLFGTVCGGRKLIANVTFLGKDYTGDMGRMGNILSHMYSFDAGALPDYPIRYYLSSDFRTSMKQEEVDGSRPVQPLAQVSRITVSDKITVEGVQRFLEGDDKGSRMEMFCHMMAALIARDSVHRVIIYDTHEHILLWIGALEYALPLKIAANVSFSSFDYNPMMSDFEIRGCVAGQCKVDIEELKLQEQHYVFDGIHREYPRFDISEDFYRYGMEVGMGFAYDSLKSFHEFLDGYRYEKLDREIYTAFRLFQIKQGGMSSCDTKELLLVLPFEEKYGSRDTCMALLEQLVETLQQSEEEEKDKLWRIYVDFLAGKGSGMLEEACEKLQAMEAWDYLGELQGLACASALSTKEAAAQAGRVLQDSYRRYFAFASPEGQAAFDLVVRAVAKQLKAENEAGEYETEMALFNLVQEISGGQVHGRGMDSLIEKIDAGTVLISPSRGMFQKVSLRISQEQSRCLGEIRSYRERWASKAPAVRLELLALGALLQNALRMRSRLSALNEVQLCLKAPISTEGLGQEELEAYWKALLEGCDGEMTGEDYTCLLSVLAMTQSQADRLLEFLLERELKAFSKGQQGGLRSLLEALWNTRERGFDRTAAEYLRKHCREKQIKELDALLASFESRGSLPREAAEHFRGLLMPAGEETNNRKWHLGGKHGGLQWRTKK